MSYFDEQNGGDASDDENKEDASDNSGSDSETNIDEDEVEVEEEVDELEDEEDDEAKGPEDEDDDDVEEKIDYKGKYGVDFGSDDNEDIIEFARHHLAELRAKYGENFGNDEEEDIKIYAQKYLEEMKEKEKAKESDSDTDDTPVASKKKVKKIPTKQKAPAIVYDEEDDEDPTGEGYLQKFDKDINDNYIVNVHPESAVHNYDEIMAMTKITRDTSGIIIDDLHKTIPFLTKYERSRILGQRAKQINSGASVFVKVPEKVIDGYLIAELELIEKRVPFIIRRPLPNGGSEYWSVKDLENISF